ncbi:MAG: S8 family serine peptidase, partial [Anaerolineales bacterium]|nr:S8 family serine peptidase [Anaerolineales bacterium]
MQKLLVIIALIFATLAIQTQTTAPIQSRPLWLQKVDEGVWQTAVSAPTATEFLVMLTTQADLSAAAALPDKDAKGRYVYEQLTAVAQQTQPALRAQLQALGVPFRSFWIANMIWVRGNQDTIATLAQRPDVAHIFANPSVQFNRPETAVLPQSATSVTGVEWSLTHVGADSVWAMGITGDGVVVGGQDTGYDWEHPGLINQYRGWDGAIADHNYNWHDAIHENNPNTAVGNPCGFDAAAPCDDHSHGTHTMGTMAGNDLDAADPDWPGGAANAVGMAPGARWIGCRNMEEGYGTPATYAECYEWFVAPYPVGGDPMTDGDPTKAPHVINNSWGCPPLEGCTDPNVLLDVVGNVRAAGIVTIHSAGNYGSSSCSTVTDPAAIYDSSFTVGNTTSSDTISS